MLPVLKALTAAAAKPRRNPHAQVRVTDPKRQGKKERAIVLARWGGLGTHRYQVGFSGDVRCTFDARATLRLVTRLAFLRITRLPSQVLTERYPATKPGPQRAQVDQPGLPAVL